jgi:hypothetical protein
MGMFRASLNFYFTVPFNAFITVRCTEANKKWIINCPNITPSWPALKGYTYTDSYNSFFIRNDVMIYFPSSTAYV